MKMTNFSIGAQPMPVHDAEDMEASQAFIQAPSHRTSWRLLGPVLSIRRRALVMSTFPVAAFGILLLLIFSRHPSKDPQLPIRFLVVGDWGRLGAYNQSEVAALMGQKADLQQPDFVISTGDNFYPSGLSSPADEAFSTSFADMYSAKSLQVPWYTVLGNHDYGDKCYDQAPFCAPDGELFYSPLHQLGASLGENDWRWHCERSYEMRLAGGRVHLFFIDTNPFVQRYYQTEWANFTGGLREQDWQAQLAALEQSLRASQAEWKVIVGHHPPRTNGHHNNTEELMQHLEPLMQAAGVQVYFAGHDHNLEHIHPPGGLPHYIISGGGSKCDRPFIGDADSLFQWQSSGFVAVELGSNEMVLEFMGYESPLGDDIIPLYIARIPRVAITLGRRRRALLRRELAAAGVAAAGGL